MWIFNTRHDFGVETDPTQGEFFVNNEIDRSSALVREAIQNPPDALRRFALFCILYGKLRLAG
jgi:hypothetical protein